MDDVMHECRLCARRCGADRYAADGFCGADADIKAARAALHMWEEPCISGQEGSGAVFFSGCPLHCVFCQNREISNEGIGQTISVHRLSEIFLELQEKGANNINLVTPTQFVPQIIKAVSCAREGSVLHKPLVIPIVYNTGTYETQETVRCLAQTVDIWLPDLKYRDPELSKKYSGAADYFDTASAAIGEMVRIAGAPVFDGRGLMKSGVLVRHMILPGCTEDSKNVLRYLCETYGRKIWISIMNQYTPMTGIGVKYPELARRVTKREYEKVVNYAIGIGIENAYIQEGPTAKESFIPSFNGGEGLLPPPRQ